MTDPALHLAAAQDSITLAEQGVIEQAALVADLRAEVAGLVADKAALLARVAELEAQLHPAVWLT